MRATLHLTSERDFLALWPLTAPVLERALASGSFPKRTQGVDVEKLLFAGRALLEAEPLAPAELGRRLAPDFPGADPEALAYTVRYLVPCVQVPPRGLWGRTGQAKLMTVESWLGAAPAAAPDVAPVIRRYLAAFGPATPADFAAWSGLTQVGDAFERLRPELRTFRDEQGRELFDIAGGPLPDADTPVPIRLLPQFDNALLAHADRSRIIPGEHRDGIVFEYTVLIDGFVRATWSPKTFAITALDRLTKRDEQEAARQLKTLARIHAR
jgi:hypothetical protein